MTAILEHLSIPAGLMERFWSSIDVVDDETSCWEWTGYTRNGYGTLSVHDRPVYAHHLSWEIHNGPRRGFFVLHSCDNKRCVRPSHLFLGTQFDNVRDMWAKGRARPPKGFASGVAHPNATLTDAQVAEIRSRWASEPRPKQRDLARQYLVSQSTIWRIVHGVTR